MSGINHVGAEALEEPVRVGIVGTGYMAREHARAFQGVASIEGVAGRNPDRAMAFAQEFSVPFVARNPEELLRRCQLDLVVIAVSELALPEVLASCLKTSVTLLVEKPIGVDLGVSIQLADLVTKSEAKAFVGLNRRQYASTRQALEQLSSRDSATRFIQILDQEDPRVGLKGGKPNEVVSNWMYANSIHLIDLIRVFGRGQVRSVDVEHAWDPFDPGYVTAHLEFDSGDIASYQAVWNRPGPWSCAVTTAVQRLEMRPLEELSIQEPESRALTKIELGSIDKLYKPGLRMQALQAVNAVRGQPHTLPDFKDALKSVHLVSSLYSV